MLAAILISAAATAEKTNGPDSIYQTGFMSVILIGLTAVPALLTLFWSARGCWMTCCYGTGDGEKKENNSGHRQEVTPLEIRGGAKKAHKAIDVAF